MHQTPHIVCPATVSHVIALFATILCVRTLYSHPTPILVPSGKDAMQQTTKQNLLRYLNMSAWLPHLKHSFPKQEDLVYLQEWKLLTNASLSYLLFLLLKVRKDGDSKRPVFWRFMWCGLTTTCALVGGCQNFARSVSISRVFTNQTTRCRDAKEHKANLHNRENTLCWFFTPSSQSL